MAGEDPAYIRWIKRQPCCAPGCEAETSDWNPMEAHHHTRGTKGRRGKSQRAHDHDSMPLHHSCHIYDFHGAAGPFKHWDRARRIEWQDAQVEAHKSVFFGKSIDRQDGTW